MTGSIRVKVVLGPDQQREYEFTRPFRIGRVEDNDVSIPNTFVSRHHVELIPENGFWTLRDLNSANGTYLNGQRITTVPIQKSVAIRLGPEGPFVALEVPPPPPPRPEPSLTGSQKSMILEGDIGSQTVVARVIDHYFSEKSDQPAGEHTMLVRKAFGQVQKKQKRKYGWIVGGMAVLVLAVGAYALYLHQQNAKRKALAESIFYNMKSLDVDIANVERIVADSNNPQAMSEIKKYQQRRRDAEKNYDDFLNTLKVYDSKMSPQQKLILRVARIFGECELDMPAGFADEVNNYIQKWKSSGRLARDIRSARQNGYVKAIADELLAADLPPQFLYLAMQESDFDQYISGPMTRKGIAKGMWQFIPQTAVKYGLKIGPLVDLPRPDPGDDRHHWDRETKAAVRYLKDLYGSDAQASGLLVMACYNWGEDYVLPLVRKMPANPRDRNFWKLLAQSRDKIPDETYNYVFYIVSAAVIGENPRLYGFDFDNPLAQAETH